MKVIMDGKSMIVENEKENLVELAAKNGIGIPAPCYRTKQAHGCCNGCVVLVNGKEQFACVTLPKDGMTVEVYTPELVEKRRKLFGLYREAISKGEMLPCDCGCGDTDSDSGCGCGDGCCG